MIEGISHITFIVKDLELSTRFFKDIFNAQEVYASGNQLFSLSKEKFFIVGGQWIAVMEGEGRSLYFYDFDNHLFEIHTGTLSQRLAGYENNDNSFKRC